MERKLYIYQLQVQDAQQNYISALGVEDAYYQAAINYFSALDIIGDVAGIFTGTTEEKIAAKSGFSAIGSTGKIGEQWLAKNLGGESQAYFSTSQGARYVDQFANGIANESKVGYTSLTPNVQLQISKDVELIQTEQIQGSTWHFFQSPTTGLGGPSQPLLNALQENGINVIIH